MDLKLATKVLEELELHFPEAVTINKLSEKFSKSSTRDFFFVLKYLAARGKIKLNPKMQQNDKVIITYDGIDYLTELRKTAAKENVANNSNRLATILTIATVILSLSSFVQIVIGVMEINWTNLFSSVGIYGGFTFILSIAFILLLIGALIGAMFNILFQKRKSEE